MTDLSMVDAAVEALIKLMQEKRWSAPQVAAAAAAGGITVSEDTVLRVMKRERKPSLEFGIWLLRQHSNDHRFPLQSSEWVQPSAAHADAPATPTSVQEQSSPPYRKEMSEPLAVRRKADISPEQILRKFKESQEPASTSGSDELVPLIKKLLERLDNEPQPQPSTAEPQEKQNAGKWRNELFRRIEDVLIKDVDEAAAERLEMCDLKKFRPRGVSSIEIVKRRAGNVLDQVVELMGFRRELQDLAIAAQRCMKADDIAGMRKNLHAVIDCAPYCEGEVLEADYEQRLCQLLIIVIAYRFQEGSFDRVYRHIALAMELLQGLKRGALGQELADYAELRSELLSWIAETKWRDTSAARDLLLTPEHITRIWKMGDHQLRYKARGQTGHEARVQELRLGQMGVVVLRLGLRYLNRGTLLKHLEYFNQQSNLGLDLETTPGERDELLNTGEPHIRLIRIEWELGKLFTLDSLLRETPGVLSRQELDRLHRMRLQASNAMHGDQSGYQRGIELEYRWILANMARASLRVAH